MVYIISCDGWQSLQITCINVTVTSYARLTWRRGLAFFPYAYRAFHTQRSLSTDRSLINWIRTPPTRQNRLISRSIDSRQHLIDQLRCTSMTSRDGRYRFEASELPRCWDFIYITQRHVTSHDDEFDDGDKSDGVNDSRRSRDNVYFGRRRRSHDHSVLMIWWRRLDVIHALVIGYTTNVNTRTFLSVQFIRLRQVGRFLIKVERLIAIFLPALT